ncbi:MAG: dihydrofolate reductase family protein [Acidobacteria bacterium]|nr:dihydrofolate reductase family protein [Acidobacteriota bacterium]
MKTVLWAEIMANGFYPVNPTSFDTPAEVWTHFYADIAEARNVILGRKTVEEVLAAGNGFGVGDALVVAVSSNDRAYPGTVSARSPRAALDCVAAAGHQTALVGGGVAILNAFLAENLADELILLVVPALGSRDTALTLGRDKHRIMRLLSSTEIGSGIVRLHYAIDRS